MTSQALMSDQNPKSGLLLRRRNKVFGFIIAEASATGLLLVAGALALSLKPADPALAWSINLLTIAAAVAVAIIPILFFAIMPVLPREGR
jgi:MFS family permease